MIELNRTLQKELLDTKIEFYGYGSIILLGWGKLPDIKSNTAEDFRNSIWIGSQITGENPGHILLKFESSENLEQIQLADLPISSALTEVSGILIGRYLTALSESNDEYIALEAPSAIDFTVAHKTVALFSETSKQCLWFKLNLKGKHSIRIAFIHLRRTLDEKIFS